MNSTTTLEEVWALFRETDSKIKDLAEESRERQREADRQLRELGQQIGGLGNKFGSFTVGDRHFRKSPYAGKPVPIYFKLFEMILHNVPKGRRHGCA